MNINFNIIKFKLNCTYFLVFRHQKHIFLICLYNLSLKFKITMFDCKAANDLAIPSVVDVVVG